MILEKYARAMTFEKIFKQNETHAEALALYTLSKGSSAVLL